MTLWSELSLLRNQALVVSFLVREFKLFRALLGRQLATLTAEFDHYPKMGRLYSFFGRRKAPWACTWAFGQSIFARDGNVWRCLSFSSSSICRPHYAFLGPRLAAFIAIFDYSPQDELAIKVLLSYICWLLWISTFFDLIENLAKRVSNEISELIISEG